jgi:WD40-like Beta Propeller Repeat
MTTFGQLNLEHGNWALAKDNVELANSPHCRSAANPATCRPKANPPACHSEGGFGPRNLLFPRTSSQTERLRGIFPSSLLFSLWLCGIFFFAFPPATIAQSLDKPTTTIDEDITAFAFAPDGRIVYSVRRMFRNKKYDMQRDDIWIQDTGGHRKRIFQGEHFTVAGPITPVEHDDSSDDRDEKGKKHKKDKSDKERPLTPPFTYIVAGFDFSPNGRMVLVQLLTSTILTESDHQQDERMTLVLDESGREIKLSGDNAVIHDAADPMWLNDNATIVYLTEILKPNVLFSYKYANVRTGPAGPAFEGRTFIASVPIPHTNSAIAIERDKNLSGPPRLQRLELLAQEDKELATLDGYETGLSVSPSGKRVAYFIDKEVLEVRDLERPNRLARVRIGLGAVQWSADESYLLVKRSPERKSGDLVWISLPPLTNVAGMHSDQIPVVQPDPIAILHGLTFRDFAISPNGGMLAVVPPGKRNLLLFPLPPH